ncbi:MAG: glycosyltransferase family 4 protein [Bacteroidota bacterium]
MRRVLVLTYYWPPSGGSGVQRWLKGVRYLRDYGWEPVVYTAENGEYPVLDEALAAEIPEGVEVIRTRIWEPYQLYKRFNRQKKNERVVSGFLRDKKPGLKARLSMWIRGNLFIPDARRFWIRPSVRFLRQYLREHPVDLIVSTGPPHTMHVIGLKLRRQSAIPWVADFRDPWTNIDFYHELMLSNWADRKHHRLEKAVVTTADGVVVVGNNMKEEFEAIGQRPVEVITNGYDEADVKLVRKEDRDAAFSIVHIGLMNQHRSHRAFWQALADCKAADPEFAAALRLTLIGKVDVNAREAIREHGLESHTEYIDYLPHPEAVRRQGQAQVLYLSINDTPNAKGVITGKIFEYLAAGRPILCQGPEDGDAAVIVRDTGAGRVAGFQDRETTRHHLQHFFNLYREDRLEVDSQGVAAYSRQKLTGRFAQLFDQLTTT